MNWNRYSLNTVRADFVDNGTKSHSLDFFLCIWWQCWCHNICSIWFIFFSCTHACIPLPLNTAWIEAYSSQIYAHIPKHFSLITLVKHGCYRCLDLDKSCMPLCGQMHIDHRDPQINFHKIFDWLYFYDVLQETLIYIQYISRGQITKKACLNFYHIKWLTEFCMCAFSEIIAHFPMLKFHPW